MDFAVFLVGDGFGVDLGDDGEGVEDFEGVVLGGAEHLEFVVEDGAPEAVGVLHAPFGIKRKGVLEVHDFLEGQACHEGHSAHHLVVDDVGLYAAGHVLDGAAGGIGTPVAHLERLGTEVVADYLAVAGQARGMDDDDLAAVGLEGGALGVGDLDVREGEEVYLMTLGEFHYLVVGAELVTFIERIGEPREDNEDLHKLRIEN